MSIEAMKQAVDALRDYHKSDDDRLSVTMSILVAAIEQAEKQEPVEINGNTSDGYHTFNELYEFRKAYNAALFNEWAAEGKCSVHKSWRHYDGEPCFGGGWFIVVAVLPQGQISNHYEAKDWSLFNVPETERALFEFDGHSGFDVVTRLKDYTTAAQPAVQEPVAWFHEERYKTHFTTDPSEDMIGKYWQPLYTTPQSNNDFKPDWDTIKPFEDRHVEDTELLRQCLEALKVLYDVSTYTMDLPIDHYAANGAQTVITALKERLK
jgi:hypothetical protein